MRILSEKERARYIHPLLLEGKRYLFNKNPFEYAKEAVAKWHPAEVSYRAGEIAWEKYAETGTVLEIEDCMELACIELAPHFLASEEFLSCYQKDGYDYLPDVTQYQEIAFGEREKESLLGEREL